VLAFAFPSRVQGPDDVILASEGTSIRPALLSNDRTFLGMY